MKDYEDFSMCSLAKKEIPKKDPKVLKKEYIKAGINASEVDTGAVIITGESAKRENAERIVELLSKETGKFVAASAGPNFEAIISAFGSGAVKLSEMKSSKILHTDVGGGTANVAVIDNGEITATACINVGGRLIVFNNQEKIVRIETPGKLLSTKKAEMPRCPALGSVLAKMVMKSATAPSVQKHLVPFKI